MCSLISRGSAGQPPRNNFPIALAPSKTLHLFTPLAKYTRVLDYARARERTRAQGNSARTSDVNTTASVEQRRADKTVNYHLLNCRTWSR